MNRAIHAVCIFLAASSVSAAEDHAAKLIDPDNLVVKVDGEKLFINDTAVRLPGDRQSVVELLGKPSRILDKANTLLVWDELGILVHEDPDAKKIKQFTVALGELKFDFWPGKLFRGKLILDGAAITADTTIEAINQEKKGKKLAATASGLGASLDYNKVNVVIHQVKGRELNRNALIAEFLIGAKAVER